MRQLQTFSILLIAYANWVVANGSENLIFDEGRDAMTRDLQEISKTLLDFSNNKRKAAGVQQLKLGSQLAAQKANKVAKTMVKTGRMYVDPQFSNGCNGKSYALVARNSSVDGIKQAWSNESAIKDGSFRYSRVAVRKENNKIYAAQIFCSVNYVYNVRYRSDEKRQREIRNSIMKQTNQIRQNHSVQNLNRSPDFTAVAQNAAIHLASGKNNFDYEGEFQKHCNSQGTYVTQITNNIGDCVNAATKLENKPQLVHTGIGAALRNDGQLSCVVLACGSKFSEPVAVIEEDQDLVTFKNKLVEKITSQSEKVIDSTASEKATLCAEKFKENKPCKVANNSANECFNRIVLKTFQVMNISQLTNSDDFKTPMGYDKYTSVAYGVDFARPYYYVALEFCVGNFK